MSNLIPPVRGMNDILPDDAPLWERLESAAQRLFAAYDYRQIRIPVLERTELFRRSIGELTDIVDKEMYTFEDRGGDSITLRPGGHSRRRARRTDARSDPQPAAEALVQRPDVPSREAAERPLSAVSPAER
jgi:hypothetical protein